VRRTGCESQTATDSQAVAARLQRARTGGTPLAGRALMAPNERSACGEPMRGRERCRPGAPAARPDPAAAADHRRGGGAGGGVRSGDGEPRRGAVSARRPDRLSDLSREVRPVIGIAGNGNRAGPRGAVGGLDDRLGAGAAAGFAFGTRAKNKLSYLAAAGTAPTPLEIGPHGARPSSTFTRR